MPRVLYYKCKQCGSSLESNTLKKLVFCKCGKIGIDGTFVNSRIVGDKNFAVPVYEEKPTYVYRIKHVPTGKYFTPYRYPTSSHFSDQGRFYSRKPSLNWAKYIVPLSECVIEKYKIELV